MESADVPRAEVPGPEAPVTETPEATVPIAEIATVAGELDVSPELSPRQRAVLALVFSLAGEAAADLEDVSGFMVPALDPLERGGDVPEARSGAHRPPSIAGSFLHAMGDRAAPRRHPTTERAPTG